MWGQLGTALLMGLPSERRFPERDVPRTPGHDDIRGTRDLLFEQAPDTAPLGPRLKWLSGCRPQTQLQLVSNVSSRAPLGPT